MDATLRVLEHVVAGTPELSLEITSSEAGATLYRRRGETLPADVLHACLDADAVLLAAIGLPDVRKPDGTEVFEVAANYPDVTAEATYVDAMSLYMVQSPSACDVLVTENQFGDILSDLGAGIVGGLGLGPSAEIGDEHALFQLVASIPAIAPVLDANRSTASPSRRSMVT